MTEQWIRNLLAAIKAKGLDNKAASVGAGLDPTAVYDMTRGRDPGFTKMIKLARAHGFSLDEIIGRHIISPHRGAAGGIPVKGQVAAGLWLELEHADIEPFDPLPVALDMRYPAEAQYGLVVRGTSINKFAADGDVLVCLDIGMTGVQILDNDMVVVERVKHQAGLREVTAKRIRFVQGGKELWPESDDPRFQTPLLLRDGDWMSGEDDHIRVIARVEWAFKHARPRS